MVKLNGIPEDILRRADLVDYMLPILRADFMTLESYRYQDGEPLQCPVTIFGGDHDPRVDRLSLEAWNHHASMYFSSAMFPGDHFFLRTAQPALLRAIVEELQPLLKVTSFA
jgi:medium-chain acyl-[acyl-carrier-protein] hydrolase